MVIKFEFVCEEKFIFGRDCEIIWLIVKIGNCKIFYLVFYYRLLNFFYDVLE